MRVRSFLLFLVFVLAGPVVAQTRTYDKYIDSWGDTRFRGPYAGDLTAAQARGSALWDKAVNLDGGMPRVAADASFRNPSGNAVPATATTRLPPAEVSKAVGRSLARIALKVAVPLSVGMELFDLGKELGFDLGRSSTGELTVAKPNPAVCSVAPCYGFPHRTLGIVSSLAAACQSYVGTYQYGDLVQSLRDVLPPSSCGWVMGWGYYQPRNIGLVDVAPAPAAAPLPSTQQEFVDAVAAKSGWPSTSAIDRVIKADVQAGSVPLTGPISVTGPATSPGT